MFAISLQRYAYSHLSLDQIFLKSLQRSRHEPLRPDFTKLLRFQLPFFKTLQFMPFMYRHSGRDVSDIYVRVVIGSLALLVGDIGWFDFTLFDALLCIHYGEQMTHCLFNGIEDKEIGISIRFPDGEFIVMTHLFRSRDPSENQPMIETSSVFSSCGVRVVLLL